MYIASQILVVVADLFYVFGMLTKSRVKLLSWLILSNMFFCTHYFLLGAYTGGGIVALDIIFLIINYILFRKDKMKYSWIVGVVFSVASIIIMIFTWESWISLLPMIGMATYFVGMGIQKMYVSKICGGVRNLANVIYLFLITSYVGGGLEIALLISAIVGIILSCKKPKQEETKKEQE